MALDPTTLDMLLQSGQITPDQHAQFTSFTNPEAPQQAMVGTDLSASPAPAPLVSAPVSTVPAGWSMPMAMPGSPQTPVTTVGGNAVMGAPDGPAAPPSTTAGTSSTSSYQPINLHGTETTDTKKEMGETATRDVNAYRKSGDDYVSAQLKADKAEADLRAGRANEELGRLKTDADDAMAERIKFEGKVQGMRDNISKIEEKYSGMEVDPNHAWGEGVTSSKIMAAIGLTLGALGSAISGKDQQSGVVGILQKIVENDIHAQEANISKTGRQLEMARGGLKDFFDQTKDMVAARDLELKRGLEVIAKRYEAIAATTADPAIRAKALGIANEMNGKVAAMTVQADQRIHAAVTKDEQQAPKMLPAAPAEALKDQENRVATLSALYRIKELKKDIHTGPVQHLRMAVEGKLGQLGPQERALANELTMLQAKMTRENFGGQSSKQELELIQSAAPNTLLSDKTLDSVIDSLIRKQEAGLTNLQSTHQKVGQNMPDWKGQFADYQNSYGETTATKFTATPDGKKK